jgi:hypothetical protein
MARVDTVYARILFRDGSRLDVGLGALHEETDGASRPRHAAIAVRARYAPHADVVRHQEFARGETIVGIAAVQVAFVIAVRRLRRGIHHRPVRVVPEQEVRILGQFRRLLHRRRGDEPFLVALAFDVA